MWSIQKKILKIFREISKKHHFLVLKWPNITRPPVNTSGAGAPGTPEVRIERGLGTERARLGTNDF